MEKKKQEAVAASRRMPIEVDAEEMAWLVHRAFERGDAKRLKALLLAGGDANARAPKGGQPYGYKTLTMLGLACALRSDVSLIKALLSGGANPNAVEHGESSAALHVLMSCESDLELDEPDLTDVKRGRELALRARALIKAGADASRVGSSGETPLILALESLNAPVREPMVAELLSLGAKFRSNGAEELTRCFDGSNAPCRHCSEDTIAVFGRLVAAGARLDESGEWTADNLRKRARDHNGSLAREALERYLESREIELVIGEGGAAEAASKARRPRV